MSKDSKKPAIRFKGFTDDWEQRKFSEITTSYSGGTPKSGTAEYYDGNIPFIRSGEIYSNKTELFITELGLNNSSAKMVHVGDILYALYGATSGEVSRAKLDGAINQAILAVLPNEEINADFLVEWFRKEKEIIIATYLQGGQGNLSAQIIKDLMVDIPSSGEQKKIGDYFTNLNNLITLHQRKLDKLKNIKKALLEKMFPRNGENIPEVRFKGFSDDWEQRKFDDVFNYLAHNSLSRDDLNDNEGSIKNIHYGDVLIKFGNVIDTKHEYIPYVNDNVKLENKACFLQDGDVVIADAAEDSTVGKCTEISESSDQKIVSGLHTIPCRPKNKFAKGFLGYYLNSNAYHDQLLPLMQGTKVSSISKTSLKETTIKFPSSIEEQKKVGACFHELDNLITLHQRKLDKLKNIKKALLEKMFV